MTKDWLFSGENVDTGFSVVKEVTKDWLFCGQSGNKRLVVLCSK